MTREQLIWAISEMENDVDRKNIAAHDQAQRAVIEQLQKENKTLRETLQTCQSRLGCGCGDILCATCSAAYDLAAQALKEVT